MLLRNAPCRYRNNQLSGLGLTAGEVKEYFDISAYRNVLDMINTFDGVLKRWGDDLHNNVITVYSYNNGNLRPALKGAIAGYAIKKVGQSLGWNEPLIYARKQLSSAGLKPLPPVWNNYPEMAHSKLTKYMAVSGYFNVADLLGLARNINWELNRLRLPIPHNFRQINEKIQGRSYTIGKATYGPNIISDIIEQGRIIINMSAQNYINLMELIDVYKQLKLSINTLRVSTRKEIDAANLAKKVQEETLRREQEVLITRQKAEKEAEARRLVILAERKAALEKEFQEAEALKIKLAETRAQLAEELKLLEASKQVATQPEIVVIELEQTKIIGAIEKVEIVAADKDAALDTAKQAAINVNNELIYAKQGQVDVANTILTDLEQQKAVSTPQEITQIEQQQQTVIKEVKTFEPIYIPPSSVNITLPESKTLAPDTEKSNLVPILLTVAAGMILT